jgi:thiol-disulfide isomerase/thioredoxin
MDAPLKPAGIDCLEDSERVTNKTTISLILVLAVVVLLLIKCPREVGTPGGNPAVGQHAPRFQLKDLQGNDVSLDQYKGKIVMLDFWATWCGPCRITMPLLEQLQQEHADAFTLLAINVGDSPELVMPYVQQHRILARVLLDVEQKVGAAYGTESIPMQVLIDQKGIIRHIQVGYYGSMKDDLWAEIAKLQN